MLWKKAIIMFRNLGTFLAIENDGSYTIPKMVSI